MDNPIWSFIFRPAKSKKENLEILKSLPIFDHLTHGELTQIERVLHERTYDKGASIFNEGEPGACMYIVKSGDISITKKNGSNQDLQLAVIHERSFFGELALLDELPRSASAFAVTDAVVFGFSKPDLENLLQRNYRMGIKILSNLSRMLGQRLLKANENLEKVQADCQKLKNKGVLNETHLRSQ